MTQPGALTPYEPRALDRPLTAAEVRADVNLIQEVMRAVMKKDTHFGTIPGTPHPTLYKAGAEKILSTFRLGVDPEIIDLSGPDERRYQVRAHLYRMHDGVRVGTGIGECSSNEDKYRWRAAVNQAEFDETPENRRRAKWKKGKPPNKDYQVRQVRTEADDVANTILKMAKKRALIDATLTATAASDVFTQDLEDIPEELRDTVREERAAPIQQPQSKKATAAGTVRAEDLPEGAEVVVTKILDIKVKSGTGPKGEWKLWKVHGVNGVIYTTFDEGVRNLAQGAMNVEEAVRIVFKKSQYGCEIIGMTLAAAATTRDPGEEG